MTWISPAKAYTCPHICTIEKYPALFTKSKAIHGYLWMSWNSNGEQGTGEKTMRTYNLKQSRDLLQVDPKTFGRWLEKAKIDKQINLADPREKLLTEGQILLLAQAHGRKVHFPVSEQSEDTKASVTLTTLDERLSALEQVIARRFDQIEEQVRIVIADLQRNLAQATPSPREHPPVAPKRKAQAASTPTRKRAKKVAKSRRLPRTLIPLHVFRTLHGISEKAAEHAIETGRLPVARGKWLYQKRYTTTALDGQGRQQFYLLFHERNSFQRCKACPHTGQMSKQS